MLFFPSFVCYRRETAGYRVEIELYEIVADGFGGKNSGGGGVAVHNVVDLYREGFDVDKNVQSVTRIFFGKSREWVHLFKIQTEILAPKCTWQGALLTDEPLR